MHLQNYLFFYFFMVKQGCRGFKQGCGQRRGLQGMFPSFLVPGIEGCNCALTRASILLVPGNKTEFFTCVKIYTTLYISKIKLELRY